MNRNFILLPVIIAAILMVIIIQQQSPGTKGFLEGKITIGPLCPVETNPPQPECLPTAETYKAYKLVVSRSAVHFGSDRIKEFYGDANGYYRIELDPGTYTLSTEQDSGLVNPTTFTIETGKTTQLNLTPKLILLFPLHFHASPADHEPVLAYSRYVAVYGKTGLLHALNSALEL